MKTTALIISTLICLIAVSCGAPRNSAMPHGQTPRLCDNAQQVILVVAESHDQSSAKCYLYERNDQGQLTAPLHTFPVVIGKNGLGWGRGRHPDSDVSPGEPIKREGDGKSPMGVFDLVQVYGYPAPESVATRMPYMQADSDLLCIDDVESEYYAMVIDSRKKGLDPDDLPSHETMVRRDNLYKYTVLVGHNMEKTGGEYHALEKGLGSCIFLHLWSGPDTYTAGCTAMREADMLTLLTWLDPEKKPVLVQLTGLNHDRLEEKWGLP